MEFVKHHFWKVVFALCIILLIVYYQREQNRRSIASTTIIERSEREGFVKKEEFPDLIKKYITEHPDIILDSIESMHNRQMREFETKVQSYILDHKKEIEDGEGFPIIGDGDVTVISFMDYKCDYCKKANDVLNQVLSTEKSIKVIYKMIGVLGEQSAYATKVALAVYAKSPEQFKSVHDDIMSLKSLNQEAILQVLEKNNIKIESLNIEATENTFKKATNLSANIGISGVPAFIIGGEFFPGLMDVTQLKEAIVKTKQFHR